MATKRANGKPVGEITPKNVLHGLVNRPVHPPDYDPNPPKKNTSRLFAHLRYEPSDFVVPGKDVATGQSRRLYCSVSPELAREVEIVRSSGKFPFQTNGDLVRWCVYRGVKELEREEPGIKGFLPLVEIATQAYRLNEYHTAYKHHLEELDKAVQQYVSSQDWGMARGVVSEAKMHIMKMSEDYWREKALAEIKQRYAYLYKDVKPAKMPVVYSKQNGENVNGADQEET